MVDIFIPLDSINKMPWIPRAYRYISRINMSKDQSMINPTTFKDISDKSRAVLKHYRVKQNFDGRDYIEVGRALHNWAISNDGFLYAKDPSGWERMPDVSKTLCINNHPACGVEDCDGQAAAIAAMLQSLDVPFAIYLLISKLTIDQAGFVADAQYSHAVTCVKLPNGDMIPIETINKPNSSERYIPYGELGPHEAIVVSDPDEPRPYLMFNPDVFGQRDHIYI